MSYETSTTSTTTSATSTRTITAFFDTRADADAAVARLIAAGIDRSHVRITAGATGTTTTTSTDDRGFWESLKDLFIPDEDRATYAEGLRRGGFLVTAQVSGAHYEKALDILDSEGTVDLDQRAATWRSEGWTGYSTNTTAGLGATGTATGATAGVRGTVGAGQEEVIALTEEQIRIGKREVEHGRVRVRSYVVETPVQEQVGLREEHVHIERRPVDRAATAADLTFKDRVIEATESVEEAVVSKDARVTEEVVLRKDATERTQTVSDTVRRTEVEVEDERGTTRTSSTGTTVERKVS